MKSDKFPAINEVMAPAHWGDSTILAALDMASGDEATSIQLHALKKIHAQKVRTLMRSISELKKELALATAQAKDHRRSAMIRTMRMRLREQELVIDVVKEELGRRAAMGQEETNDWVIRKTVGGPLRFRPKTREELQNDFHRLERQHRQALSRLRAFGNTHDIGTAGAQQLGRGPDRVKSSADNSGEAARLALAHDAEGEGEQKQSTSNAMRLADAQEELDELRVAVRCRDATLQAQADEIDGLQADLRGLRGLEERVERKERRALRLKKRNVELGEKHMALLDKFEACQEQIQHLKTQLQLKTEEVIAEADQFRELSLRQAEEVGVLLKREEELATALERDTAAWARESREKHHEYRQALGRAEAAEKGLKEANRELARLKQDKAVMVTELQRLGKEAAEAAGLRERGRELAREVKRIAQEGQARQLRLEEARERGARAEESLRLSQESLEEHRKSTHALRQEVDATHAFLCEERALRSAQSQTLAEERKRLSEAEEARERLESLLASEREKERPQEGVQTAPSAPAAATEVVVDAGPTSDGTPVATATTTGTKVAVTPPKSQPAIAAKDDNARRLSESRALIAEMMSELSQQADHIGKLEEEKEAADIEREAATKTADDLRMQVAEIKGQLHTARGVTGALVARDTEIDDLAAPARRVHSSMSADETERNLREQLVGAKAAEQVARREMDRVKAELEDVRATCALQKARVTELVAERDATPTARDDRSTSVEPEPPEESHENRDR